MILTDREIQIALDNKSIIIDPTPTDDKYSSTSLDLTLDSRLTSFKKPKAGVTLCIDPASTGYDHEDVLADLGQAFEIHDINGYEFQPQEMILAWTIEYVELPYNSRVAARV